MVSDAKQRDTRETDGHNPVLEPKTAGGRHEGSRSELSTCANGLTRPFSSRGSMKGCSRLGRLLPCTRRSRDPRLDLGPATNRSR